MLANKIEKVLAGTLPGEKVQWKMASSDRMLRGFPREPKEDTVDAAVLILLYGNLADPTTLFIRRQVYNGVHSGQISFPGGKREYVDTDLVATALREASEETGISTAAVRVLGKLTPLYIPVSNINVTPYVGWYEGIPIYRPQRREVEKIITAKVNHFFSDSALKKGVFPVRGQEMEILYFDCSGEVIWGATAMIFNEFLEVLRLAGFEGQE